MDTRDILTSIGLFLAFVGGCVALFNARQAVLWKRAELANNYLKELTSDDVLVFACRALDWDVGRLAVPRALIPLLPDKADYIIHDEEVLKSAMPAQMDLDDLMRDPRLQLYRTAMDSLLSWMSIVSNALKRNLCGPGDIREIAYWVDVIEDAGFLEPFIDEYGYRESQTRLRQAFAR
ncbi:MAG TPA: hypothetical protein VHC40_07905 [Rhizomicrobium sp.]|jgi:hypothetical protein|nr:hypothetical protein [Rhizomicrobium sp.]